MTALLVVFLVIFISLLPIVVLWVRGLDYMHKNHPDYKGNDLFGDFSDDEDNQYDKDQIM